MKNRGKVLGFSIAVLTTLSVFFKLFHLTGASLIIVISLGMLFPIYLIINIVSMIKDSKFSIEIIILGIFFLIFTIGLLFIIQHWYLGELIYGFGFILLLLTLFIFLFLESKKKNNEVKIPVLLLVLFIIFIDIITVLLCR